MAINPIFSIMNDLTNERLIIIIHEIKKADDTGFFDEASEFRKLMKEICEATSTTNIDVFMTYTLTLVFKEYTYRQLNLK
jgi:hypothetical protein